MEVAYQVNRRKACDLCFLKKIKCDMQKPICSNCQTYKAECRTTMVRKKYRTAENRAKEAIATSLVPVPETVGIMNGVESDRIEGVESRLARIERQIDQVLAVTTAATTTTHEHQTPLSLVDTSFSQQASQALADFDYTSLNGIDFMPSQPYSAAAQPTDALAREVPLIAASSTEADVRHLYPSLPPLAETQPAIEDYFTRVNSLIPLFSPTAFARMLQDYYASICHHPRAVWAAVNVVLALAAHLPTLPSNDLDLGSGDDRAAEYINNAQSVLTELVTEHVDLLSLQIVLGLTMVFNAMKDSRPAPVLISTAVRLAHRLHLHSRDRHKGLSPEEVLQRQRVFWITYLFDKDICLRHHMPSLQHDADITMDLPSENPLDEAGNVYSKDGRKHANFFRLRLRLAHIQGQVYDMLFSARAANITSQERQARTAFLHNKLERWRLTVPSDLQAGVVMEHVSRTALVWLCTMHFSYLGCLVMIHGIWSHDAEWRKRLITGDQGPTSTPEMADRSQLIPPLPAGWKNCVQMSRYCMMLMHRMPLSDCNVWANGCAYFSALLLLQANLCEHPLSENADTDLQLTSTAISVFDRMSEASTIMQMKRMNVVAAELDRRVRLEIRDARRSASACSVAPSDTVATLLTTEEHPAITVSRSSGTGLQWDWETDGVEAWPNMDVSLSKATVYSINENHRPDLRPVNGQADIHMQDLFGIMP